MVANDPLRVLINELSKLPGIGEKTAARLAFYILASEDSYPERLAQSISEVKKRISICNECFQFTEQNPCPICSDEARDGSMICVVEQPSNLFAIERTGEFKGRYHVLHGALSPLNGIGPDQIRAQELFGRIQSNGQALQEIILATNPNTEGEATALYLGKLLTPLGLRITKIASGVPVGSDLEYTDQVTLSRALAARQTI